eukprot:1159509-Pelagomonas_calceolata.AAC.7
MYGKSAAHQLALTCVHAGPECCQASGCDGRHQCRIGALVVGAVACLYKIPTALVTALVVSRGSQGHVSQSTP